jgi:hypothetical protein
VTSMVEISCVDVASSARKRNFTVERYGGSGPRVARQPQDSPHAPVRLLTSA